MKNIALLLLFFCFTNFAFAQKKVAKAELNFGVLTPQGNLADKNENNANAYFSEFGFQTDLTLRRYSSSGFGFGLRLAVSEFYVGKSMFAKKLLTAQNSDDFANYGLNQFSISNTSVQLSLSYNISIGKYISIEPFFNSGVEALSIPEFELHYLKNGATHLFRQDEYVGSGISINPGLSVNIELNPIVGFQLFGAYSTAFMEEYEADQLTVSPNDIDNASVTLDLSPEYVSFGAGITVNLRKKNK